MEVAAQFDVTGLRPEGLGLKPEQDEAGSEP